MHVCHNPFSTLTFAPSSSVASPDPLGDLDSRELPLTRATAQSFLSKYARFLILCRFQSSITLGDIPWAVFKGKVK